jgi:hypothetical protein
LKTWVELETDKHRKNRVASKLRIAHIASAKSLIRFIRRVIVWKKSKSKKKKHKKRIFDREKIVSNEDLYNLSTEPTILHM